MLSQAYTCERTDKERQLLGWCETVSINKHQINTKPCETYTSHAHHELVLPHSGLIMNPQRERHFSATSMFNKQPEAVGLVRGRVRGQKASDTSS